ncbi:MAG: hypothetical protein PHW33_00785 [Candidatus Portnoybacteria bacterium]|jgi:hypothetical protein|nr:hypothetical protein [Candidatus Portnoybacteria bacterium]
MPRISLKFSLGAIIILEIIVTLCLLRVYNRFVADPENYYHQILEKNSAALND